MSESMTRVKPILFSGPMVRALLDGRKSQTRRVLKDPVPFFDPEKGWRVRNRYGYEHPIEDARPYLPGDLLWVRETWAQHQSAGGMVYGKGEGHPWGSPIFKATFGAMLAPECEGFTKWCPSIHMPRWASRLTLEVTGVKVERLQEISEEDARAEGMQRPFVTLDGQDWPAFMSPVDAFAHLWNSLNAKRGYGWEANPWIVALTFRVHQMNVDDFLAQRKAA